MVLGLSKVKLELSIIPGVDFAGDNNFFHSAWNVHSVQANYFFSSLQETSCPEFTFLKPYIKNSVNMITKTISVFCGSASVSPDGFHHDVLQNLKEDEVLEINIHYTLTNRTTVVWKTSFVNKMLYLGIPQGSLPDGSKDAFVGLLEYAEDVLLCKEAVVYFPKNRADRGTS